jgi:hypothetical protein
MWAIDLLGQLTDDGRAGSVGEVGQFAEMVVGDPTCARSLERCADEEGALNWRCDDDRFAAYLRILVMKEIGRSACRLSGVSS